MTAWAIRVPLQDEESLSSWLVRAALRQGCDPLTLTGAVWPHWRVWTTDVDRGLTASRTETLSRATGIPATRFAAAALRADLEAVVSHPLADDGTWPWLLGLGARNRRRLGGQQMCPACLAEDPEPYLRRQWRYAWHTACLHHGTLLLDRCPACCAPIAPHLLVARAPCIALCSHCGIDLRTFQSGPSPAGALDFQAFADRTLRRGSGVVWSQAVPAPVWFDTARALASIVRAAQRRNASALAAALCFLGVETAGTPGIGGLGLELQPRESRGELFTAVRKLMLAEIQDFERALVRYGVSAATLSDVQINTHGPLMAVIKTLPRGGRVATDVTSVRCAGPAGKRTVLAAWARLQRRMLVEP